MYVYNHVFHQIWEVWGHCFLKLSLCPFFSLFFWDSHNAYVDLLDVPHRFLKSFTFLQSFSFPQTQYFLLLPLKVRCFLNSSCSNLHFNLTSEILILVIVIFGFRISFFFLVFHLFIVFILFVPHFLDFLHISL